MMKHGQMAGTGEDFFGVSRGRGKTPQEKKIIKNYGNRESRSFPDEFARIGLRVINPDYADSRMIIAVFCQSQTCTHPGIYNRFEL